MYRREFFWNEFNKFESQLKLGFIDDAIARYDELCKLSFEQGFEKRIDILDILLEKYNIESQTKALKEINVPVDDFITDHKDGVSLVTCCMNRSENMLKALPTWLENDSINEILIVDWSSDESVLDEVKAAGLLKSKVRVVRVDDQPRWILSYAFNLGFRLASYNRILKTDADIMIHENFFDCNQLNPGEVIAGDWKVAEKGQEHINGFFYLYRDDLMKVKGFNEYITTYGWDDDDIYNRLHKAGIKRVTIDTSTIYHIPHDDFLRVSNLPTSVHNAMDELKKDTIFNILTNKFIADVMPIWNEDKYFLPFNVIGEFPNFLKVKKIDESIHFVPKHIQSDAETYTLRTLLSWRIGLSVFELDNKELIKLISNKLIANISPLDVYSLIYNKKQINYKSRNLLVRMQTSDLTQSFVVLEMLSKQLLPYSVNLIVASDFNHYDDLVEKVENIYWVPSWFNYGQIKKIDIIELYANITHPNQNDLETHLNPETLTSIISKKFVLPKRKKIFIDAQHGLGNRLRAIASAASIAKKSNRELVIVWEADHHCECEFDDLFQDYEGKVIQKSFIDTVDDHYDIYNYMEAEEGAEKDKPIVIESENDLYLRAAYTFNSELSDWDSENIFLQSLILSDDVQALVNSVDVTNCIAAHVRMEAGEGLDHNSYDSIENWTIDGHKELHFWREKSHYSVFIKRIDEIMSANISTKLFIATDMPETYEIFKQYYTNKFVFLERNLFDRSREQIKYALADAVLLSKCNALLGSTYSSFSELAMRLSNSFSKIEMSGEDF